MIGLSTSQHLQMNDWLALHRLPFTPLHRLWIYFLQPWHRIELLPTPFLHTPQGHLPFSFILSFILQLNITFVFPVFIFKPFGLQPIDLQCTIFSRRLSSLSAIMIKSSAYSNSRDKPAVLSNSLTSSCLVFSCASATLLAFHLASLYLLWSLAVLVYAISYSIFYYLLFTTIADRYKLWNRHLHHSIKFIPHIPSRHCCEVKST